MKFFLLAIAVLMAGPVSASAQTMPMLVINLTVSGATAGDMTQIRDTLRKANDAAQQSSYGVASLMVKVVGPYEIQNTGCSGPALYQAAEAAATAAGVDVASYKTAGRAILHFVPHNAFCKWGFSGFTLRGSPSRIIINGANQLSTIGHELFHAFGLPGHSNFLGCNSVTYATTDICKREEYGNPFDIMSIDLVNTLNLTEREALHWAGDGTLAPIATVTTSGGYRIGHLNTAPDGQPKGLKFPCGVDRFRNAQWCYVEHRTATGYDSNLSGNTSVLNGALIILKTTSDNLLLDLHPLTTTRHDAALAPGESWTAPGGVTIQNIGANASGLLVAITLPGRNASSTTDPMALQSASQQPRTPTSSL